MHMKAEIMRKVMHFHIVTQFNESSISAATITTEFISVKPVTWKRIQSYMHRNR
jgi:hypothetical protein